MEWYAVGCGGLQRLLQEGAQKCQLSAVYSQPDSSAALSIAGVGVSASLDQSRSCSRACSSFLLNGAAGITSP